MKRPSYVVITPVRNEAGYVGITIDSMSAQTVLPRQWVIVDDGSTDGTSEILEASARMRPWIAVVRRPDRGYRKSGGGVVEAFYDGYALVADAEWDSIVKLDADLEFAPDYFQCCLEHFERDARLGIGGGTVCVQAKRKLKIDSPSDPPFHVRGATKIYRRACWADIHPLAHGPGWDTIDEVRANMHGWRTRSFDDVRIVQHRETGAVDGEWANCYKNGLANYLTGYHPVFMTAKCLRRLRHGPRAAAALFAGFCTGYLRGYKQLADAATVRYLREQQLRCLLFQPSIYRP